MGGQLRSLAVLIVLAGCADDDGSARRGRALAEDSCAACHRIAPDRPAPAGSDAPDFATLAAGLAPETVRARLLAAHPLFSDFPREGTAFDDLLAYFQVVNGEVAADADAR